MTLLNKMMRVVVFATLTFIVSWSPSPVRASAQLIQFTVEPTPAPPGPPPAPAVVNSLKPLTPGIEPSVDPTIEYGNLTRFQSVIGPIDSGLLGESVDFSTGQTDFVASDVSLPGNFGIPFGVGRRFHVANQAGGILPGAFGDWDLDIPRVEGVVAANVGWTVSGTSPDGRCTNFSAPPPALVTTAVSGGTVTTSIAANEYGFGFSLVLPGQGRRELLQRASDNPWAPAAGYPVVTHDWWISTCTALANPPLNVTGEEGFTVVSPAGVNYQFIYYSQRAYPSYQRIADTTQSGVIAVLPREQVFMLPYIVQDRFGNWVKYSYNTDETTGTLSLATITSSDNRIITLSYMNGLVSSITDGTRTWHYTYVSGSLSKVTLPDGSYWSINFANLGTASWTYTGATCTSLPTATYGGSISSSGTVSGTIQHPTGASGTFTFSVTRHGRNSAPTTCLTNSVGTSFAASEPSVFDVLSLTKKQITGPNISTLSWTLAYAGCSSSSCNATKTTLLTDARNYSTLYTFGAVYNTNADSDTEGQLQSVKSGGMGGSGYLRTDSYTYFLASGQAYPSLMGTPTQVRGDTAPLTTLRPVSKRTSVVDGVTYTQTMSTPDTFGFPATITRAGGTSTKTDTLTYEHNTSAWIIGTLKTKKSGGATEFTLTLNSNEVPTEIDRFGRKDKTISYNGDGTVETVADGDNNTTTYTNYSRGIPQNIKYANNDTESVVATNIGGITSWTNAAGFSTSYGHDLMGRVSSISPPVYSSTSITWATNVSGWTRTQTRGSYTKTDTYDAFLRSVNTTEPNSRIVTRSFDADGRNTFTSYPNASAGITFSYDGLGRLHTETDGGNYVTTYTPGANTLGVQDRDGNTTTYTYLTYDDPSTQWPTSITTPLYTTSITRDTWGKPKTIARGSITRTRGYYSNQLLETISDPEHGDYTFTYDNAANLKTIQGTDAVTETRYYDKRNRIQTIDYSNNDASVGFTWTPDNLPDTSNRGGVTRSYSYNTGRLLQKVTEVIGSGSYALTYGYNTDGQNDSLTYPDTTSVSLGPDAFGRPTLIGTYATSVSYFPNGALDIFEYGNGIFHTTFLDSRQLPQESQDGSLVDWSYTYDGNANPKTITDNIGTGANSKSFTYDTVNRLKTANASKLWGNATFTYDTLNQDNLTIDSTGSTTTNFIFNASTNLLTSFGSPSIALIYDKRGNLSQKGTGASATAYAFNAANLLTSVTQGSNVYSYSYDAAGLRAISSITSGVTQGLQVNSLYDDGGRLMYEATTVSANPDDIFQNGFEPPLVPLTTTKYYYLGSHLIAKDTKNGSTDAVTYVHTDALGSPIAQTSASKAVVATTTYLPYGGLYASTGTGNQAGLGYAGQYADGSGLVYMHARYYDPQLHRFISIDPMDVNSSTAMNFNRYSYGANSPYAKYDPSGRSATNLLDKSGAPQPLACDTCLIGPTGYWQTPEGATDELTYGASVSSAQVNAPPTAQQIGAGLGYVSVGAGVIVLGITIGPEAVGATAAAAFFEEIGLGSIFGSVFLNATSENVEDALIDSALFSLGRPDIFPALIDFLQAMQVLHEIGNIGGPDANDSVVDPASSNGGHARSTDDGGQADTPEPQ
jgi:RHS repeat-associated protein